MSEHARIVIVGSGFSGLGMAARLKQEGVEDFVVLERADEVGGTWRDNTYPGCQCDVPSNLYSFSFAANPGWSRAFSMQPEIQDYLVRCADEFGVRPHMRFGHELTGASWDQAGQIWRIETSAGDFTADVVVSAVGGLSEPRIPDLPGLSDFRGEVFHSAAWRHDVDLAGKRVAVVGTGASAIQIVPKLQREVEQLYVFQRTPAWIMPHTDRPLPRWYRRLFKRAPALQRLVRGAIYWGRETFVIGFMGKDRMRIANWAARRMLARQVPDPELRRKLTPDYSIGCKRILLSNDFYPALQQPNVELLACGVSELRPGSIVGADGSEREVDVVVFATGFHVTDMPIAERVAGRDGRALADVWQGSPRAYLGTAIPGFPNLFFLLGPNTGLGHTSIVVMIEAQVNYVMQALRAMERGNVGELEVRADVQEAYNRELDRQLENSVWNSGGCASWYLDEKGRNSTLWPGFTWRFRQKTARFQPADYEVRQRQRERVPEPVA